MFKHLWDDDDDNQHKKLGWGKSSEGSTSDDWRMGCPTQMAILMATLDCTPHFQRYPNIIIHW